MPGIQSRNASLEQTREAELTNKNWNFYIILKHAQVMASGLANICKYLFCNQKHSILFLFVITNWHLLIYFRFSRPLTGRPVSSQGGRASHREAKTLTKSRASHREAVPLTEKEGLSQEGWASNREAGFLTGRPALSQGGQASHREAGPLTGRLGL